MAFTGGTEKTKVKKRLEDLKEESKTVVFEASSVFPFQLFPDKVVLDLINVTVIYRYFFFTEFIFTMDIENINTVTVNRGPFFASLKFEVTGYEKNPAPVTFLWREDAQKMRDLIVGAMQAAKKNADLKKLKKKEVGDYLSKIGSISK